MFTNRGQLDQLVAARVNHFDQHCCEKVQKSLIRLARQHRRDRDIRQYAKTVQTFEHHYNDERALFEEAFTGDERGQISFDCQMSHI